MRRENISTHPNDVRILFEPLSTRSNIHDLSSDARLGVFPDCGLSLPSSLEGSIQVIILGGIVTLVLHRASYNSYNCFTFVCLCVETVQSGEWTQEINMMMCCERSQDTVESAKCNHSFIQTLDRVGGYSPTMSKDARIT